MSFPNGELCVKRTGVGGKGVGRGVSHTEGGLQLVSIFRVHKTVYV